jgi:hypothetical protein
MAHFVLPALVIGLREDSGGGIGELQDGGDQGDELIFPVALAVGDLVLDDPHVPGLRLVQVLPGAGGIDELFPCPALDLGVDQH